MLLTVQIQGKIPAEWVPMAERWGIKALDWPWPVLSATKILRGRLHRHEVNLVLESISHMSPKGPPDGLIVITFDENEMPLRYLVWSAEARKWMRHFRVPGETPVPQFDAIEQAEKWLADNGLQTHRITPSAARQIIDDDDMLETKLVGSIKTLRSRLPWLSIQEAKELCVAAYEELKLEKLKASPSGGAATP